MVNSNGISFTGLASGLDTAAIVQQLVALERIPIQLIELKKGGEQAKLDKLASFEALVKSLKSAAEGLATASEFFTFKVSNSDPSIASIAVTGAASEGAHTIDVQQLAATDRWGFDGVVDADADLASADGQSVSFDVNGTSYSIVVNQVDSSLNELAAEINNQAGADVTATVVNAGTDASPDYRLVIASDESGEDFRISNIASTVAGLTITYSAPDVNGDPTSSNNLTVGSNAQAVIDGLLVERTTNDFSDVLTGIEIDALAVGTGPITFSVEADKEAIRGKIDAFVAAYNEVIEFANQQNTFTPAETDGQAGTSGVLFGEQILSTVVANIRRALDTDLAVVLADTEGYSTLRLVGIETNNDGTLEVNSTVLDEKMANDLDLFADLFVDHDGFDNAGADPNTSAFYEDTTADSGLAASLVREIDRMFGTFEGPIDPDTGERIVLDALFDAKQDVFRDNIERFEDRIAVMERRLEKFEETLILRFARLEELMGALNAQGAALAAVLQTLPSSS